ncbi:hypothetical protein [Novosphingobium resinovorum]|uniref:Holin n=1 Tax=Novosphingobium resinovorum TaxID=158500 RepID=A0A1D8A381_9SPHN|nr:hypothetical protein [Novosphingobium resinovorum]AOR76554.1 hypothetical protein BES08_07190 [Novosphingobium resinovorum]
MRFKLFDDWKKVLVTSWSNRITALNAVLLAILTAWPDALVDIWTWLPAALQAQVPQHIALALPLVLSGLSMWARVVVQEKLENGGK